MSLLLSNDCQLVWDETCYFDRVTIKADYPSSIVIHLFTDSDEPHLFLRYSRETCVAELFHLDQWAEVNLSSDDFWHCFHVVIHYCRDCLP